MWWLAGLLFFIIILFLTANYLYKQTNNYSNCRLDIKNYIKGIPYDLQMVNLGSTYAKYAFGTYEDMNINGCDLSLQAQSLEMDYAILKQYADHIAPGGVVVFVVAAACLLLYREVGVNLLYYDVLDKNNNPLYEWRGKLESVFPLLFHPRKIKMLIKDTKRKNDIYDRYPTNLDDVQSEKALKDLVGVWKKLFSLHDMKSVDFSEENRKVMQRNREILGEMLDLCQKKGFRPVIVVPPFSIRLNQYFSEEFKEKVIRQNIRDAVQERRVPVLNYQDDEQFQNAIELFADGGFKLNRRGSQIFLSRLTKDLQQYGIEISNHIVH